MYHYLNAFTIFCILFFVFFFFVFFLMFLFFFFFQAEDGIRDWSVTGVQTCALPISCRSLHLDNALVDLGHLLLVKLFEQEVPEIYEGIVEVKGAAREPGGRAKLAVRSEERRVGKECRWRWSAYHDRTESRGDRGRI